MSAPTRSPLTVTVSPKYSFVTTQSEASTPSGGRSSRSRCSVRAALVPVTLATPAPFLRRRNAFVGTGRRHRAARQHVHLVRGEDDPAAVPLPERRLEGVHLV